MFDNLPHGANHAADSRVSQMRITLRTGLRKCFVTSFLLATVLMTSWPRQAFAHASLARALPAAGSEVTAPTKIDLWFNELLEDGFNSVTVIFSSDANATSSKQPNLAVGTPVIDPHDKTHLTITVKPLRKGTYMVQWRVLSRDGHSAPGQFSFRVIESH